MKTALTIFTSLCTFQLAVSQQTLQNYIDTGLEKNLVLTERNISLERSQLALQSAKSYFLPSVDFGASYTLAQGGRTIDLPLGDLFNGVYSTLNEITGASNFPQLENVQEQFFPNNFYDARVRISYPLLNPDIHYARQIREEQVRLENHEIDIYRADLIRDIRHAYYNYGSAQAAVEIYTSAKILVERNLRNSESLLENGSGLYANVLRAESEVEQVNAMLIDAENKRRNASLYLNFLVNLPLEAPIDFQEPDPKNLTLTEVNQSISVSNRPEMMKINTAVDLSNIQLQSQKAYVIPKFNTFLDLGAQDFDFAFDSNSRYYMLGVQMSMPIFNGNRNRIALHSARLNLTSVTNQMELLEQKLQMSAAMAKTNVSTALAQRASAQKKREAARMYFNLIDKGFLQGSNSLIEFLDARNQLTGSELQLALANYHLLTSQANLEREFATTQPKNQ